VRELDVLFTQFLTAGYEELSQPHKLDFQRLLEVQDPTIMDWLFSKSVPQDSGLSDIIELLKSVSGISLKN
jgi:succinate dehydrogenase flavin-adding protein (antitoxin of CptAB toxin-antitoxin module)